MLTIQRTLERLSALPHRASASIMERRAFEGLEAQLREVGLEPRATRFSSPNTYSWEVIGAAGLIGLGALAALADLGLGFLLAALGTSWFHCHFSGLPHPLEALVPRYASQNLETRFGEGARHLVLMAHVDTAKSAFLYAPGSVRRFRQTFVLNAVLAYLTPLLIVLLAVMGGVIGGVSVTFPGPSLEAVRALLWVRVALLPLGAYFLVNAALFYHRERTAPFVNGANDNASGVAAALEVASRLRAAPIPARVTLLLTGSEEVGARGAAHFAARLESDAETLVLNLDNVGRGGLHFVTGEGMLQYHPYDPEVVSLARSTAQTFEAAPLEYRLAYFDTLPFALRGVPCLTLIALENGLIPNWHWSTDTLERVDPEAVSHAANFAEALARAWAHPPKSS